MFPTRDGGSETGTENGLQFFLAILLQRVHVLEVAKMRGVDVAVDERVHLFPGAGRNLLFAHGSGRWRKSRVGRDQKERVACGNKEAEKLLKVWKEHPKLRLAKLAEELPQERHQRIAALLLEAVAEGRDHVV